VVRNTTDAVIGKVEEIAEAVAEVAQEVAIDVAIDVVAEMKGAATVAEATVTAEVVPKGDVAIVVKGTDQANFCEQRSLLRTNVVSENHSNDY
jgi:hypothetical protein